MFEDELLDLVNEKDEVIGTILRSKSGRLEETKEGFIRAATALIRNDKGQLWIPRRTSNKPIAPNGLDSSMQEHVMSGESYLKATIRGFDEELGIKTNEKQLIYIGRLPPSEHLYYFISLYLHESNQEPNYNPDDFVGFEWIKPEDLIKRLKNGEPAKDSLLPTVELLLAK